MTSRFSWVLVQKKENVLFKKMWLMDRIVILESWASNLLLFNNKKAQNTEGVLLKFSKAEIAETRL